MHIFKREKRIKTKNGKINAVILSLESTVELDTDSIDTLSEITKQLDKMGIVLMLARVYRRVRNTLKSSKIINQIGQNNVFKTVNSAVEEYKRRITQDEYDKKHQELIRKQYELNDKLKRIIEANEAYTITLISLLNICSRAPELFESSKVEQKRQLINFLLSNLKLRDKILEFELKKPFDMLINLQNCEKCSVWLAVANDVGTRIMTSDKIIFIPEMSF